MGAQLAYGEMFLHSKRLKWESRILPTPLQGAKDFLSPLLETWPEEKRRSWSACPDQLVTAARGLEYMLTTGLGRTLPSWLLLIMSQLARSQKQSLQPLSPLRSSRRGIHSQQEKIWGQEAVFGPEINRLRNGAEAAEAQTREVGPGLCAGCREQEVHKEKVTGCPRECGFEGRGGTAQRLLSVPQATCWEHSFSKVYL